MGRQPAGLLAQPPIHHESTRTPRHVQNRFPDGHAPSPCCVRTGRRDQHVVARTLCSRRYHAALDRQCIDCRTVLDCGRHLDPSVPGSRVRRSACGSASTDRRHEMADAGNRHRCLARRAARDDAQARGLLADGLRLAQGRGAAQCVAAVRDDDRWRRHPFHSCPLEEQKRAADHHHARLARLDHRTAEDHRSAHEPDRARRQCSRFVRRRDSVAAGLRFFGQTDRYRLGPRSRRAGVDDPDEAPRLHAVRRSRRRLGRCGLGADGTPGAARIARDSHQHAGHRA